MRFAFLLVAAAGSALGAACSSPAAPVSQGGEDQACYANGTCNAGLSCFSSVCVNANVDGGSIANDAGAGSPRDAGDGSIGAGSDGSASDSGGDGSPVTTLDAGPDAGSFSVASIPGLALWLDAAKGVTPGDAGSIASWSDQSSTGNNFRGSGTVEAAALNGQPLIRTGPGGLGGAAAGFAWGLDAFLLELVVVPAPSSTDVFVASETGSSLVNDLIVSFSNGDPVASMRGSSIDGPSPLSGAHVVGVQRTSSGFSLRVDGAVAGPSSSNAAVPMTPTSVQVGGGLASVEIAEVVAVHGAVSDGDRDALEAYFKVRYGL